ncbi:MAG: hypothetical protein COW65_12845 [Cytophagales bacterium CG18_big_fil_WC_8_21_14_2_50_42_9]|nr:MAG: hypothetical protein COW65_12845 [Cytophagales bacterium CG18_big_fil_WC_8_21_14_2_50_42_9]
MTPKLPNLNAIQAETPPSSSTSRQSKKEKELFEHDKLKNAHNREQRARNVLHYAILALLGLVGFCLAAGIIIRVIHLVASESVMWLTKAQLDTLDDLFKLASSGVLGGLLTRYLTRNVEE